MAIATTTAAIISAAVALAGTAAGAAGAVQQSRNQREQAEYQAGLAERNARIAEQNAQAADEEARAAKKEGYENAARKRQEAARIIGAQRAQAGASGAQTDAGGTLDRVLDTAEKGELDALSLQQQGANAAHNQQLRAWGLRNQAQSSTLDAQYLRKKADTDYLGLTTTLLNGASPRRAEFLQSGRARSAPALKHNQPFLFLTLFTVAAISLTRPTTFAPGRNQNRALLRCLALHQRRCAIKEFFGAELRHLASCCAFARRQHISILKHINPPLWGKENT